MHDATTDPAAGAGARPRLGMVDFLDLTALDGDRFEAPIPHYPERSTLFGGQVAAQALRAAALTVPDGMQPSSLHSYYLTAGALDARLEISVDRLRDGRSYANRRVEVVQGGRPVLALEAAFHRPEPGPERPVPMPDVPGPDELADRRSPLVATPDVPLEVRTLDRRSVPAEPRLALWVRSSERWPADSAFVACLVTFVADMRTGWASLAGLADWREGMITSLDHNLWFHHEVDPSSWLLVDMRPVANADARGLVLGTVHDAEGTHAATFVQEVVNRPARS